MLRPFPRPINLFWVSHNCIHHLDSLAQETFRPIRHLGDHGQLSEPCPPKIPFRCLIIGPNVPQRIAAIYDLIGGGRQKELVRRSLRYLSLSASLIVSRARCLRSLTRLVVKRAANALIRAHFEAHSTLSGERNVSPKPTRKINICKEQNLGNIPLNESAKSVSKYPRSLNIFTDEISYSSPFPTRFGSLLMAPRSSTTFSWVSGSSTAIVSSKLHKSYGSGSSSSLMRAVHL